MSDIESALKNLEDEKKALTEKHAAEQDTDVKGKLNDELNEITEAISEAKVRHDTVK